MKWEVGATLSAPRASLARPKLLSKVAAVHCELFDARLACRTVVSFAAVWLRRRLAEQAYLRGLSNGFFVLHAYACYFCVLAQARPKNDRFFFRNKTGTRGISQRIQNKEIFRRRR